MWLEYAYAKFNCCSTLGGRGVAVQRYLNIPGSNLNDLYSNGKFPDSPDRYSVNPSFQSEIVRCDCLFVGLFVCSIAVSHSLCISHQLIHKYFYKAYQFNDVMT